MSTAISPIETTILIRGLAVRARVGVGAIERRAPQTVLIDAELRLVASAIARDDLRATVNYAAVARRIEEVCETARSLLLEMLAERIATAIFDDARIAEIALTITKPRKLPNCETVGVRRTFRREEVAT